MRTFYLFLYNIIIFLSVFDSIRGWFVFGQPFSFIKEGCTLLILFGLLLSKKNWKKRELLYSNIFFIIYLFLFGTIIIVINDQNIFLEGDYMNKYILHFKTIESMILIFLFFNYEYLTKNKIEKAVKIFLLYCFFSVIISVILYFFAPTSLFVRRWFGRISVGYPTSDSIVLCFGLIILMFLNLYKRTKRTILIGGILIGIILNNTNNGYLGILIIFFLYFLFLILQKGIFNSSVFITTLLGISGLLLLSYLYSLTQGDFGDLLRGKIDYIVAKITGSSVDLNYLASMSEDLRKEKIENSFSIKKDLLSLTFGGPISTARVIENEGFFLLRSYGYIGLSIYSLWLFYILRNSIINFNKVNYRISFVIIIIYILSGISLISTYMYNISASFSILLAYLNNNKFKLRKK